ncbi:hypothetical protein [Streptomyces sp. NPDC056632]|uniref:hypothetical protein n=1 Tax=Streptomyces sp. NPDC056632 TaxID=3345884 RepID=UPI0036858C54
MRDFRQPTALPSPKRALGLPPAVILVGGHESNAGRALLPHLHTYGACAVAPVGPGLGKALADALSRTEGPVCVVPMTLGRDPGLVAGAANLVRRTALSRPAGRRLVFTRPLGLEGQLDGWLLEALSRGPSLGRAADNAVLVTAAPAGPVADGALRSAARRLARHTTAHVTAALERGSVVEAETERLRRLGARRIVVISAGLAVPRVSWAPDVFDMGPLLGPSSIRSLVGARCAAALHDLAMHEDDGVTAVLGPHPEHRRAEPVHDARPHPREDER